MTKLKRIYTSPSDLDVIHIEHDFHVTRVILTKTHPERQQCQIRFYWLEINKLGYVFQEEKNVEKETE